jgi:hypothetical protein
MAMHGAHLWRVFTEVQARTPTTASDCENIQAVLLEVQ